MPEPQRKMSDILLEMAKLLLRDPRKDPSSEAANLALFLANAAWNECIGLNDNRKTYRQFWATMEASRPTVWDELTSRDVDAMIDELKRYKNEHFPNDQRRILACGIPNDKVRVHWLPPVAPGVDSKWEMQLYGLVFTGQRQKAIHFLQDTRHVPQSEAAKEVLAVAARLGLE